MMDAHERQQLAEHLASMKYQKARNEVRKLDPDAKLKLWRNSVNHNELHTTYELPNLELRVILVEQPSTEPIPDSYMVRAKTEYIEARVVPLKLHYQA